MERPERGGREGGYCEGCSAALLGACRSGEYCRFERELLVEQAREDAAERGHVLGEFVKQKRQASWEARCVQCGKVAVVYLDPSPGQLDLSGEALRVDCPDASAGGGVSREP